MSIQERVREDAEEQETKVKQELQTVKDKLYQLKSKRDFFEHENFLWFFKSYIKDPLKETRDRHDSCEETNKGFILKGKVQAYKKLASFITAIDEEIKDLVDKVYKLETPDEESPNTRPEN